MHILLVNDDGPPSTTASPYILDFARALQSAGHTTSVLLPHTQRSWIGKAHLLAHTTKASYYRPPPPPPPTSTSAIPRDLSYVDTGTTSPTPLPADAHQEEWVLIDTTPASCVQLGLHHFFQDRGPVDLVISGPNYGRNTTAVFALSSGTLGAALEAAVCGVRALALSFAFFTKEHDPPVVRAACRAAVRVVEALVREWKGIEEEHGRVQVFSVNVPLVGQVESARAVWTYMLQNQWRNGSSFVEIEAPEEEDAGPEEVERRIREGEGERSDATKRDRQRHFKWSPRFKDVYESVEEAPPGNDGWAINNGHISITPLRANFMHVDGFSGDLKL